MNPGRLTRTALREAFPPGAVNLDEKGYLVDYRENLIPGVEEVDFRSDLESGAGNELHSKFRAPHSSSALAVNCFAPFRRNCGDLDIPGVPPPRSLAFEVRCPCGLSRATPPNLDVLLETDLGAVVIESKLSEMFRSHGAGFSRRYLTELPPASREGPWFAEMHRIFDLERPYAHLDAAQLIKHAFGLRHRSGEPTPMLLYLYWEPVDGDVFDEIQRHRAEVEEFGARVEGGTPAFAHMSYLDLWARWAETGQGWVRSHARALLARYAVTIGERKSA